MLRLAIPESADQMQQWARILAHCSNDLYKYVRVLNGVASVTNGHILLRRPCSRPDGFYDIDEAGNLSRTEYKHGLGYPDLEPLKPKQGVDASGRWERADINGLAVFSQRVRELDGKLVINKTQVFMKQNPAECLHIASGLNEEMTYDPLYIHLAMIELLRYDFAWVIKEPGEKPLVLGNGWTTGCALVMPMRG